jgi:hypothetical protein
MTSRRTIRDVDWGTAIIAIVVAAIGFGGGYFSAQWQAHATRAQWRREQLLQYSGDLLSIVHETLNKAYDLRRDKDVTVPDEMYRRLLHAYESVSLLSEELGVPASQTYDSALKALNIAEPGVDEEKFKTAVNAATKDHGDFLVAARDFLIGGAATQNTPWWKFGSVKRA